MNAGTRPNEGTSMEEGHKTCPYSKTLRGDSSDKLVAH